MTQDNLETGPDVYDVLFLDDMEVRHQSFMKKFGMQDVRIWQARSATEAIEILKRARDQGQYFAQVFLDHDLSLDDIMCPPGGPSKVPTGMDVVDFICGMKFGEQPRIAIVHSMNEPAARIMVSKLNGAVVRASWVPFHMLVS